MKTTTILALLIALSLLGIADAWYLAESALSDTPLVCGPGMLEGCNAVAQSPYSKLFGIPLGVYGVGFYSASFVLSVLALSARRRPIPLLLLLTTIGGALASIVFISIQLFLIKAFCMYCLISAAISFALFGLAYALFTKLREPVRNPEPVTP